MPIPDSGRLRPPDPLAAVAGPVPHALALPVSDPDTLAVSEAIALAIADHPITAVLSALASHLLYLVTADPATGLPDTEEFPPEVVRELSFQLARYARALAQDDPGLVLAASCAQLAVLAAELRAAHREASEPGADGD